MFHCNGWCHPWAITAAGGTQVCLRAVRGDAVWRLIDEEGVTHLNGAPAVLSLLVNAPEAHPLERAPRGDDRRRAPEPDRPRPDRGPRRRGRARLRPHRDLRARTRSASGRSAGRSEEPDERARLLSRQGVAMVMADPIRVVDEAGRDVPRDGATVGEIVMTRQQRHEGLPRRPRGDRGGLPGRRLPLGRPRRLAPRRLHRAARPGQGHRHLRRARTSPRSRSSRPSPSHPAVLEAAVVGVPDDRWGERPKAFVVLRPGGQAAAPEELRAARPRAAGGLQMPRRVRDARRAAAHVHRQGAQDAAPRAGEWEGRDRRIN